MNVKDKDNEPKENEDEFNEEFDFGEEHGEHDEFGHEAHDEEPAHDAEHADEEPIVAEPPKRKNLIIPIVVAVAVLGFIGWKVIGYLFKPEPKPVEVVQPQPEPIAPPPKAISAPSGIAQPKAPTVNLTDKRDQDIADLQKKLQEQEKAYQDKLKLVEQTVTKTTQDIQNNQQMLSRLQDQINALTASIKEVTDNVKIMHDEQAGMIAKLQEKPKKEAPKPKPKPSVANPKLVVHALIPGRAWLRTVDGKTITVSEGDNVGEYGKVIKIDANDGIVVTSSGVVLR